MAQYEPGVYRPSDEIRVFDGGENEPDEEGSRLPLLIVIALLVFIAFGGVVWLAYNQGVKHGREDVPGLAAANPGQTSSLKMERENPERDLNIYQSPKVTERKLAAEDSGGARTMNTSSPSMSASVAHAGALVPAGREPDKATPSARTRTGASVTVSRSQPNSAAGNAAASLVPAPVVPKNAQPNPQKGPAKSAGELTTPQANAPNADMPASAGEFVLQIGAYKSEGEAMQSWRAYKASHTPAANYAPDVKRVDLPGKGTWYRLRIGGFSSAAEADTLCAKLKASGGACFASKR